MLSQRPPKRAAVNAGALCSSTAKVAASMPAIIEAAVKPFASIKDLTVLNGAEGLSQVVVGAIMQAKGMVPEVMSLVDDITRKGAKDDRSGA